MNNPSTFQPKYMTTRKIKLMVMTALLALFDLELFAIARTVGADLRVCHGLGVQATTGADTQVCPYTDLRAVLELEDPGAAAGAENAEGSQRE
jgi:hypothetical protein